MGSYKKFYLLTSILIFLVLIIYFLSNGLKENQGGYESLKPATKEENPLEYLNEDFTIKEGFKTNLPIVLIDTNGVEPPISSVYNQKENRHILINGLERYVDGKISIIDNGELNKVSDEAKESSYIKIRRRGNSSMNYDKAQYLVKLVAENGEEKEMSILGMGDSNEWVINGSMTDRSLMRNYLGYKFASKIMEFTPDFKYCELIVKNGEKYEYKGVYLIGENIRKDADRIDIKKADTSKKYGSYILRRDRYDENAVLLKTYCTLNNLCYGYIELIYPGDKTVNDGYIDYVTEEINIIEKALYSGDIDEFRNYDRYIDVESFIDYFLINEFFGNYDAGNNSTYMYKDQGGKLKMGPVWDFDSAIDNFADAPMEYTNLSFYTAPWFEKLVNDKIFMDKLITRFYELRKGLFSEENIENSVNEVEAYLVNASKREWARWSYNEYNEYSLKDFEDNGETIYRESTDYNQEIYKIKTVLKKHCEAMAPRLVELERMATLNSGYLQPKYILMLLALVFIVPIWYIGRL